MTRWFNLINCAGVEVWNQFHSPVGLAPTPLIAVLLAAPFSKEPERRHVPYAYGKRPPNSGLSWILKHHYDLTAEQIYWSLEQYSLLINPEEICISTAPLSRPLTSVATVDTEAELQPRSSPLLLWSRGSLAHPGIQWEIHSFILLMKVSIT